jgi:peroxiredoxin
MKATGWRLEPPRYRARFAGEGDAVEERVGEAFELGEALSVVGAKLRAGDHLAPVCNVETKRWEEMGHDLPPGVRLYTASMDLPSAMARWQREAGVGHQMLSSHRDQQFGTAYGVLINEWRLLQRSVFVIDASGRLDPRRIRGRQMREPD